MNGRLAWIVVLAAVVVLGSAIPGSAVPGHGLPRDLSLRNAAPPTETVRGYLVGEFNVWGQWNNQAKVFDLVDHVAFRTQTYKLAFASDEMYRLAELNDGMAVAIRAVRATREDNEWYVVLSMEVLP